MTLPYYPRPWRGRIWLDYAAARQLGRSHFGASRSQVIAQVAANAFIPTYQRRKNR